MSNVNLAATAATTTYNVSLEQMAALIAENLMVPVECLTVRYKLASGDCDGPGFASQHVSGIEVIVDNVAKEKLEATKRRAQQGFPG